MDSDINVSLIDKHFKQHQLYKSNVIFYRNKIIKESSYSINEINICDKIRSSLYHELHFSLLEDYETLNIKQINANSQLQKLKLDNQSSYFMFKYNDIGSVNLIDDIYNQKTIKNLIYTTLQSFIHIANGLEQLNKLNICYFDFSPTKILFLNNYREKPVISNFANSIDISKINNFRYFLSIFNKIDDFTYQPFEIHLLYYLLNDHIETVSYSFIEEFCEEYMDKLNILSLFSKDYKISYKNQCILTLRTYINKSKREIVTDILNKYNKWDIFGLSVLYLKIFGNIVRLFSLKGTFLSRIIIELSKNIDSDSNKRSSLSDLIKNVNKYLNDYENWEIVNSLDNSKLSTLFTILSD